MSHLLHLDSSLRTEGSRSRRLTARCAERWKAKNPMADALAAVDALLEV